MPVDFFAKPCNNSQGNCRGAAIECLQPISSGTFGISDAEGGRGLPAKIVSNPNPEIDFIVNNLSGTEVLFKAVDWCVDLRRAGTYNLDDEERRPEQFLSDSNPHGDVIKRCEGFLQFDDSIVFVEVKNRPRGRWLKDAREKFEETILSFNEHHPRFAGRIRKPILCNPSFRGVHQNETVQRRILKDKIGLDFVRQECITI
ncbi:MAG: hypothetical protein LC643_08325 [Bacteroidales bacterium]|nr:hypothetical protein [Bacteroidales bacterium]